LEKIVIEYESPLNNIEENDSNIESVKIAKAIEAALLQQVLVQISNISKTINTIVQYGQKAESLIQTCKNK